VQSSEVKKRGIRFLIIKPGSAQSDQAEFRAIDKAAKAVEPRTMPID